MQERSKSYIEFGYQIILSVVKFRKKFCEVYDTNKLVKEVSELTANCECETSNMAKCSSKLDELRNINSIGCRQRNIDI